MGICEWFRGQIKHLSMMEKSRMAMWQQVKQIQSRRKQKEPNELRVVVVDRLMHVSELFGEYTHAQALHYGARLMLKCHFRHFEGLFLIFWYFTNGRKPFLFFESITKCCRLIVRWSNSIINTNRNVICSMSSSSPFMNGELWVVKCE